jgi:TATA-box binding protein (TBP) (component of TFIID and TFIIIB)
MMQSLNLNDEWAEFLQSQGVPLQRDKPKICPPKLDIPIVEMSKDIQCEDLYISTKTKVLYLDREIDTHTMFWAIPIVEYWKPVEGVIKKQMKIVSNSLESFEELQTRLKSVGGYYTEHVLKNINNPTARKIKFKDDRKITIGLSKKDVMNCRGKVKKAFMNCFAMIIRFKYEDVFREIHVKVFNTGKLEIPGVLNSAILDIVREKVVAAIQPFMNGTLGYIENAATENVLINSNFNCGFFIHREKLYSVLRGEKYGIETSYDPCIYPGIKCKYYYNNALEPDSPGQNGRIPMSEGTMKLSELEVNKKYTEVSFMIFRTGSCLIVGNCSEEILMHIFAFIKQMLRDEYANIMVENEAPVNKSKKTKLRKKNVHMSNDYYAAISSGQKTH